MDSCLFCKIIAGEIPNTKVYEDDTVFAFLDIHPVNIGHVLVIPKTHYENLYVLPDAVVTKMALAIKRLSIAIRAAVAAEGINIAMNNDSAAGQVVEHAHMHVIPRYKDDGFQMWHGKRGYNEGEMTQISEKIKTALI